MNRLLWDGGREEIKSLEDKSFIQKEWHGWSNILYLLCLFLVLFFSPFKTPSVKLEGKIKLVSSF